MSFDSSHGTILLQQPFRKEVENLIGKTLLLFLKGFTVMHAIMDTKVYILRTRFVFIIRLNEGNLIQD